MNKKIFILSCWILLTYSCASEKKGQESFKKIHRSYHLIEFPKDSSMRVVSKHALTRENLNAIPSKDINDLLKAIPSKDINNIKRK